MSVGNTDRRAGCVTSPRCLRTGGWEHCPGSDGWRNLRPLCGSGWKHHLPGGLRNPPPVLRIGGRETLPGKNTGKLRRMGCVTSARFAGVAGNTIRPVGCVTPPRCSRIGGRETLPGNHRGQLAAGRWMGCVTSYPLPARREVGTPSPGGLRNLAPGACAPGRGNTARSRYRLGCVTSSQLLARRELGTPTAWWAA